MSRVETAPLMLSRSVLADVGTSRPMRVLPPVAALAYPGLIWCGPALTPIFLGMALLVPWLGLLMAHRTGGVPLYPRSRRIAFAVVGAPPLFSLLGGLLDFQQWIPLGGLHVWIPLWTLLAWVAFAERPISRTTAVAHSDRLAVAHGISGVAITSFATAHLINHVGGLWSGARHIAIMTALRHVYRHPFVELVLLASIAFQVASGVRLLQRKLTRAGDWFDTLQIASAAYLAMFLVSHLTAVLRARYLRHVDTNWVWLTTDSLLTDPWSARLAPYYFLAVIALGVHGGAGIRKVMVGHGVSFRVANGIFYAVTGGAVVLSGLILTALLRA
jgi:succinate dehydrogenase/fumarate reductase cytochrome b subunit